MLATWVKHSIAFLPFSLPSPSSLLNCSLLKWLCHGCLLHFVTIVTRIRLIKVFPWGESMTGLLRRRRPSLAIFLFTLFIYSLLCSGCFCFQFRTGFCFVFILASFLFFSVRALEKASAWFSLRLEIIYPDEMWMMWYTWLGFNLRKNEWPERVIREAAS